MPQPAPRFDVEPSDLRVGRSYRQGKALGGPARTVTEISPGGDYLAWETPDGVDYGTQHVRQFCNFASGPHGGLDGTSGTQEA